METATPSQVLEFLLNPVTLIIVAWLIRELFTIYRQKGSALDLSIATLSEKIGLLSISIVRLETKLESLEHFAELIPKLQSDVSAAHEKIRDALKN